MRSLVFLVSLLIAQASSAEFTAAEKTVILRIRSVTESGRYVMYYAMEELRVNQDPAVWPLALDAGLAAWNLQLEAQYALDNLIGSLTTDIPSNKPLSTTLTQAHRVDRAEFYWNRVAGGYLNGALRAKLDALKAGGAITAGINTYSYTIHLANIDSAYAQAPIDPNAFHDREPPWWPFLVRRAADNVGVHGHFEFATENLSQGINYIMTSQKRLMLALQKWSGPISQATRTAVRTDTLTTKDLLIRLLDVQLSAFNVGNYPADQFSRLFDADEDALIGGGLGLRVTGISGLSKVLADALATGQTATATDLSDAMLKLADGWGLAVDQWTWDSIRFPCIAGFASVGCDIGKPVEALLPQ